MQNSADILVMNDSVLIHKAPHGSHQPPHGMPGDTEARRSWRIPEVMNGMARLNLSCMHPKDAFLTSTCRGHGGLPSTPPFPSPASLNSMK